MHKCFSIQNRLKLKLGSLVSSAFATFSSLQKELVFTIISRENMKNAIFCLLYAIFYILCKHVNILIQPNVKNGYCKICGRIILTFN